MKRGRGTKQKKEEGEEEEQEEEEEEEEVLEVNRDRWNRIDKQGKTEMKVVVVVVVVFVSCLWWSSRHFDLYPKERHYRVQLEMMHQE